MAHRSRTACSAVPELRSTRAFRAGAWPAERLELGISSIMLGELEPVLERLSGSRQLKVALDG